ncbi:hypothetical protein [Streptomyces humi]
MSHTLRPALCVAPVDTAADVKALRAFAHQVAYETGRPTVFATHTDHDVRDYSTVYVLGDITTLRGVVPCVLMGEALVAGVDVFEPLDEAVTCPCGIVLHYTRPYADERGEVFCAECTGESACAWCGEWNDTEDLAIAEHGNAWIPLHDGCLDGIRRATSTEIVPLVTA